MNHLTGFSISASLFSILMKHTLLLRGHALLPVLCLGVSGLPLLAGHSPEPRRMVRPAPSAPQQVKKVLPAETAEPFAEAAPVGTNASIPSGQVPASQRVQPPPVSGGSGPLTVEDLVQHALASIPELERFRGEIARAEAERLAAYDWENPELRLGYSWGNDDRYGMPYTESSRERISGTEQFSRNQRTVEGDSGFGFSETENERGTVRESRYREVETRVIPGKTRDVIEKRIFEDRKSSSSSRQTTAGPFGALSREASHESERRRSRLLSREVVQHPDSTDKDEQFSIMMRLEFPDFLARKAVVERITAEIQLAEARYLAEAEKVAQEVHALYDELCMESSKAAAHRQRAAVYAEQNKKLEALGGEANGFGSDIVDGEGEADEALGDADKSEAKADRLRSELASLCAVSDESRIRCGTMRTRRIEKLAQLPADYLVRMALIHRPDVLDIQARLAIAQAELKEVRAARAPTLAFLDLGYNRSETERRYGEQEEVFARVGITLPVFEWLGWNKAREVPKADIQSYQRAMELAAKKIEAEVGNALGRVQKAEARLASSEKRIRAQQARAAKGETAATNEESLQKTPDEGKPLRSRAQALDRALKEEANRYDFAGEYNQALQSLEKALGTRIERILQPVPAAK